MYVTTINLTYPIIALQMFDNEAWMTHRSEATRKCCMANSSENVENQQIKLDRSTIDYIKLHSVSEMQWRNSRAEPLQFSTRNTCAFQCRAWQVQENGENQNHYQLKPTLFSWTVHEPRKIRGVECVLPSLLRLPTIAQKLAWTMLTCIPNL